MHFPVLNLHRFLNALLQIDDNLVGSLRLNVLVDIAVCADSLEFNIVLTSLKVQITSDMNEYGELSPFEQTALTTEFFRLNVQRKLKKPLKMGILKFCVSP